MAINAEGITLLSPTGRYKVDIRDDKGSGEILLFMIIASLWFVVGATIIKFIGLVA